MIVHPLTIKTLYKNILVKQCKYKVCNKKVLVSKYNTKYSIYIAGNLGWALLRRYACNRG